MPMPSIKNRKLKLFTAAIAVIILAGVIELSFKAGILKDHSSNLASQTENTLTKSAYENTIKLARSEIWKEINTDRTGSATVAIMDGGKFVYSEGFGMADRESSIPVDSNTVFNIGSSSKMYVTAAIMLLVDDGKIVLDKPVTDYFPDFKMLDPRYKDITVRMLLNHSSGFPGSHYANAMGTEFNSQILQETLDILSRSYLKADPGATSPYCNDGFSLAEMIVERISGMKYMDFLKERVFIPLGLKNTGVSVGDLKNKVIAEYYHPVTAKMLPAEVVSPLGAGGLSTTAEELCRFADSLVVSNKLLKKESLDEMNKPQPSILTKKLGENVSTFGLGWDSVNIPKYGSAVPVVLTKGGNTDGYSSQVYMIPDKRLCVAVIEAGVGAGAPKISLDLLDSLLVTKGVIQKEEKEISLPIEPETIPQKYASYSGYYAATGGDLRQITFDMRKNIFTAHNVKGGTPDIIYVYSNGHFTDKDGAQKDSVAYLDFVSIDGEDYLTVRTTQNQADQIILQKVKTIDNPQSLKIDVDGKQWLQRNVNPFVDAADASSHITTSLVYGDLPGYVYFIGAKKIERPDFAGMPFSAVRDQTELTLIDKNNTTWAWVSDRLYSPAENVGTLFAGNNTVKIAGEGYNEWLKTDEGMILNFTKPEHGRIIIFEPNDNAVIYDNVYDTNNVYVPKDSLVEFGGSSGDTFNANGDVPITKTSEKILSN